MKRKFLPLVLALCTTFTTAAFAAGRSGVVTLDVDLSAQNGERETRLWIPYPVTDRHQKVGDIKVSGDFDSSAVYTEVANGTRILYARWPAGVKSRKLSFSFGVDRQEIRQTNLPTIEPPWNRAEYAAYLKPTALGPIDGEVRKLADSITEGKHTVLAKARAVYDWCCSNMYRDPATVGCGKGDVCALLRKPGGKCTDISSVYVALCRAAGVPARELFGLRLGKKPAEEITTYQHCWAEFFLPGYGWVTVDPADVRKAMLAEKLELGDEKAKEYREFFWGGIDAYRVVLGGGRDLILNPPQSGAPLNTFGYPYAEVGGTVIDFYRPERFVYRYSFKERRPRRTNR